MKLFVTLPLVIFAFSVEAQTPAKPVATPARISLTTPSAVSPSVSAVQVSGAAASTTMARPALDPKPFDENLRLPGTSTNRETIMSFSSNALKIGNGFSTSTTYRIDQNGNISYCEPSFEFKFGK